MVVLRFGVMTGAAVGDVFFGTDTGYVYALDAKSGCVYWSFMAKAGVRASDDDA